MPRQRSVARAPSRPTASSSAPAPQQTRPAATMAAPPAHAPAPPQQPMMAQAAPQGPGLFGQMASTAAGVAIGSSVGHAIGGFFSGGSSEPAAPAAPAPVQAQAAAQDQPWNNTNNCAGAAQTFTQCMNEHNGNMQICNWYLEQLKACQAAAANH